jgi:hypothetical protein
MSDTASEDELVYHLLLDAQERAIAVRALGLLISDEAHEPDIRRLAREAIELLEGGVDGARGVVRAENARPDTLSVPLTGARMKIVHSAVRLLLLDTQRDQESERVLLHNILEKLPDEHTIRAIELP